MKRAFGLRKAYIWKVSWFVGQLVQYRLPLVRTVTTPTKYLGHTGFVARISGEFVARRIAVLNIIVKASDRWNLPVSDTQADGTATSESRDHARI